MAPRARYFDALIVEKMFRHHATASISGWDSINRCAREVSRKPYLVALPSAFRRAGCYPADVTLVTDATAAFGSEPNVGAQQKHCYSVPRQF
jgi:hypothetical protein